mmetsp:Transcript_4414/g.9834  ORF Transcript_4414/g.9834 Transcript_4414/m.9834 type:complete len:238 (+) Transcript_4414:137-850(+)
MQGPGREPNRPNPPTSHPFPNNTPICLGRRAGGRGPGWAAPRRLRRLLVVARRRRPILLLRPGGLRRLLGSGLRRLLGLLRLRRHLVRRRLHGPRALVDPVLDLVPRHLVAVLEGRLELVKRRLHVEVADVLHEGRDVGRAGVGARQVDEVRVGSAHGDDDPDAEQDGVSGRQENRSREGHEEEDQRGPGAGARPDEEQEDCGARGCAYQAIYCSRARSGGETHRSRCRWSRGRIQR